MIHPQNARRIQGMISIAASIGFGLYFAIELLNNPVSFSQFDSGMMTNTALILLDVAIAVYTDKKKFAATGQLNSFISTAICLAVVLVNVGLYFYLVG
ncbi:MAG: hypothetical protein ACTHJT_12470 [Cytophaga sp.]|uniref:hypothetical protein n=1 Tax=Cytophaga sp. TaxID=29535 RepID=UPI003F8033A4